MAACGFVALTGVIVMFVLYVVGTLALGLKDLYDEYQRDDGPYDETDTA